MRQEQGLRLSYVNKKWLEIKAQEIWFSPFTPSCKAKLTWNGLDLLSGHSRDRALTSAEYDEVIRIIRTHNLPCQMLHGDISYRLAVAVYEHPELLGGPLIPVFAFSDMHLPHAPDKLTTDVAPIWNKLRHDIIQRPENLTMLTRYKLHFPNVLQHYCV